ncbi:MAG: hypothetical protein CSA84_01270 [Actinomycetales bacterium]|nr:MAG: hypothetical protein CSA84_01270 [Actinomycetales bacterium]
MKKRLKDLTAHLKATRVYRAWERFSRAKGNLLAAGIAYFAFFSLFPALALAAVVFGFVLQGRPDLLAAIGDSLNESLPGFVKTASNPGGLIELSAPETATLSWAGGVSLATLLLSGLGWIGALRQGIRTVFGAKGPIGNPVVAKLRDLMVFALFGVAVVLSATLTSVASTATQWLADLIGFQVGWLLTAAGLLVSLMVDTFIMVVLLRLLSGVPLPWHDVRSGALLGGIGMTVLKVLGSTLIARATANPLFGSIVVVVGLLFWLNLIGRLTMLSAAWAANDIDTALAKLERERGVASSTSLSADNAGGLAGPGAGAARARPATAASLASGSAVAPTRQRDRISIAAGALLGAAAVATVGAAVRGVRERPDD